MIKMNYFKSITRDSYLSFLCFRKLRSVNNKSCFSTSASHSSKINKQIGFIGDGNMAKAIFKGITSKGIVEPSQVHVSSPYKKNLEVWSKWNANVSQSNSVVTKTADIVFIAVKPYALTEVISSIKSKPFEISNKLFVSVLAGITLHTLENLLDFKGSRVVRVMPNTPMLVGEGCTVYCPGHNVSSQDIKDVRTMLEATGLCDQIPENMIDAVCALSGSGPAFVYLTIEALSDGAVRMGLPRELATRFAAQTVLGAAKMVKETGKHMGALKDDVCSAGGTTIAGMHALERAGARGAFMNAVEAAARRAIEMGKEQE